MSTSAHTTTSAGRDFPELDAIRFVAALGVVVTHTAFFAGLYTRGTWGVATQRLEVGVAVFFVLSGFLLGLPYVRTALGGRPPQPLRAYARKRVLRIMPVYVIVVVLAFALIGRNQDLGFVRLVKNLLLIDYYDETQLPFGLTQMWSLSVEVAFYAALPFLGAGIIALARRSRRPVRLVNALLLGSVVVGVAWVGLTHVWDAEVAFWAQRWLPAHIAWFAGGLLLATAYESARRSGTPGVLHRLAADRATCWIAAGGLFLLSTTPLAGSALLVELSGSEAVVRHVLYLVVAVLVVLPSALGPGGTAASRVLADPRVRHLGHISYALFCTHMLVLELLPPLLGYELFTAPWLPLFAAVLLVSLAASELLYRYVERPAMSRARPAATTAAKATSDAH